MGKIVLWIGLAALVLVALDRALLRLERRGLINYRGHGLSWGAASYHTLELHSLVEPGMEEVLEAKNSVEVDQDESGAPPGDPPGRTSAGGDKADLPTESRD